MSLQVPMTSAPPSRASWAAYMPTPPAAADTTMVSPGCGFTAATDAHAVAPAPAIVAAASHDSPAGLAATAIDAERDVFCLRCSRGEPEDLVSDREFV